MEPAYPSSKHSKLIPLAIWFKDYVNASHYVKLFPNLAMQYDVLQNYTPFLL